MQPQLSRTAKYMPNAMDLDKQHRVSGLLRQFCHIPLNYNSVTRLADCSHIWWMCIDKRWLEIALLTSQGACASAISSETDCVFTHARKWNI